MEWCGLCLVGTDRTTADGDMCNKIGTYLKALAAHNNDVPFYIGLPSPTIDFAIRDGLAEVPIEQRSGDAVSKIAGRINDGTIKTVTIVPDGTPVANYAFDVTPARLITECGVLEPSRKAIAVAFPERVEL